MGFIDLNLKKAYSYENDEILFDFYIPVMEVAVEYHRIAGFFSSSSLAVAARGVLGLIRNDGLMKLVTSPKLTKSDFKIIQEAEMKPEKYYEKKILEELDSCENEFIRNHLSLLGWMLVHDKLEIKIAMPYDDDSISYDEFIGIFHPKVGIFTDEFDNKLSFSGSVNESARGWLENFEEFKVFRGWH